MKRFWLLLLAGAILLCTGCRQAEAPTAARTVSYETVIPAAMEDGADRLQRYEVKAPALTQEEMTAVMEQMAQRGGVSFIDTEEQWESGTVVGTRALCSSGLVIRVWQDGTMQLIWPETLEYDAAGDSDALYRAYCDAYAHYLQFDDPVFRPNAADGRSAVILDGVPTEDRPFPAMACFIPGDEERGDRLEITFDSGEANALGLCALRSAEEAAAELSFETAYLTYARLSGSDIYEPVYVFHLRDGNGTEIRSALEE